MALKKPLKIVIISAVVVVALLAAAAITLRIMFPPEKVKAMVLPHVERAVGRKVAVDGAGLSFYPVFGVKITGLEIANTGREGFSDEPFVKLGRFLVGVRVLPLFQRKLEIKEIVLRELELLVETDRQGAFNYDDLAFMGSGKEKAGKKPESKEPRGMPMLPVPLTMERFALEDARVVYHDRKAGRRVTLGDIDQRVDFSIDKELRDVSTTGEMVISDVSVRTAEVPTTLSGFTVTLTHDVWADVVEGKAKINTIRASLQKIFLEVTGEATGLNQTPRIDLAVRTDKIFIADLLAEVPTALFPDIAKLEAEGFIEMAMDLTGTIDSAGIPRLAGHVSFGDGMIKYEDLPKAINGLNADIQFTGTSLTVKRFAFKLGENPVEIMAQVDDFASPTVDAGLKATVDLDDVKDIVELPNGVTVGGMVKSEVTAKGKVDPADPSKLAVDGSIAIADVRATTPEVAKPIVVNGKTDFTNTAIAGDMKVRIGSSDLDVDTRLADYLGLVAPDSTKSYPRPKLSYNVRSSLLDVDEIMAKGTKGAKKGKGESAPAPLLAAPLPGVDLTGNIAVKKLVYGGVALTNLKTTTSAVNDIVDLDASAGLFKGALANKLHLDARNVADLKMTNRFEVDRVQVSELVPVARGLLGEDQGLYELVKGLNDIVAGQVSLKTDMRGRGATSQDLTKTLEGTVDARLTGGTIKAGKLTASITEAINNFVKVKLLKIDDIDFREMKVRGRVKEETFLVESLDMSSSSYGDWEANGGIGFDGGLDLVVDNRLPRGISQRVLSLKGVAKKGAQSLAAAAAKHLDPSLAKGAQDLAGQLVDGAGPVADNQGRITIAMALGGTAAKPTITRAWFRKGEGGGGQAEPPQKSLKARAEVAKKKAELEAKRREVEEQAKRKLEEERARAEAEAKRKAAEAKRKAEEEIEQKKQDVKKEAGKKLKGLLGR